MKLAVSTYSLWRWRNENGKTLDHALEWIAKSGAAGVEFVPIAEKQSDPVKLANAVRKRCDKLKLPIVSYCVGAEFLATSAEQRKVVERLKRHVDAAEVLGVPSMRHDVTRGVGAKSSQRTLKSVVPAVREVSEYAASKKIKTSLENHGFYMQASKRVEQLIKAVDHPNFGLTIDLGNFLCVNENPTDATKRLAKYVIMAHAKDFHVKPKSQMPSSGWFATPTKICLRGAIAGHGVLELRAQLRLLRKAGYNGYVSLEFEGMEEPTQAIKLGLEYLTSILPK